ncbi:hypothetical protein CCMA1212_003284 [Trichoderma ghanense]|uniref:Rhodopsin domain-containing protein n=1 Tax=Trichoderma ghanense TaxID=65468 RepID=A0ABY2H8H0_9HYPO
MSTATGLPESAAFLAENRQAEVYAVATVFFVLSLLALSGRLGAARIAGKPLWWDDWFAIIATICGIGGYVTTMLYLHFGLGRHAVVVAQEDPQNLSRFLQTIVANEIVYTAGLAFARLSIVFLYYRIFGSSNMKYFLHGFTAFIVAWSISTFVPSIRTCWPISSFWDGTNQNCIDLHGFYVGVAVGSIVTDFGLIVLPMPYIWNLKVRTFQKVLLALTMVFGGFSCFVTIFRLAIVVSLDLSDLTWNTVDQIIWTTLELFW